MSTTIVNRRTAAAAIADRATFRNSTGSLYSTEWPSTHGRLPQEHSAALTAGLRAGTIDYVIMSYATPIGWTGTGGDVVPDVRYSPTTSGHQGIVRTAFSAPADYIAHSRSLQRH